MPWFSGFSSDFAFSAIEDFLDFVVFFTVNEIWGGGGSCSWLGNVGGIVWG